MQNATSIKDFAIIALVTGLWLNISGFARFLPYVVPEARAFLPGVPDVAALNLVTLSVWSGWAVLQATLYVFTFWLCAQAFGNNIKAIAITALMTWSFCFVLLWVGIANLGYAGWNLVGVVLLLTLFEALVAAFIMSKMFVLRGIAV